MGASRSMGTAPHVAEHEADRSAKCDRRRLKTVAAKSLALQSAVTYSHVCILDRIRPSSTSNFRGTLLVFNEQ